MISRDPVFPTLFSSPSPPSRSVMTHFNSNYQRDRGTVMNRVGNDKGGSSSLKRSNCDIEYSRYPDDHKNSVFDYQRVPSVSVEPSPVKRLRLSSASSTSSTSSCAVAIKMKSIRASSKNNNTSVQSSSSNSSNEAKLKMAELLAIKRDLMVIKVQVDELLDCVDKMDRQRKDCSDYPQSREPSVSDSPHQGSVGSLERDSPEPGEASEEEPLYYHHYYPQRIKQPQSDTEENL